MELKTSEGIEYFIQKVMPFIPDDKDEYQIIEEVAKDNSSELIEIAIESILWQITKNKKSVYTDSKNFWFCFNSGLYHNKINTDNNFRIVYNDITSSNDLKINKHIDLLKRVNDLVLYDSSHLKHLVASTQFLTYNERQCEYSYDSNLKNIAIGTSPTLIKKYKKN